MYVTCVTGDVLQSKIVNSCKLTAETSSHVTVLRGNVSSFLELFKQQ